MTGFFVDSHAFMVENPQPLGPCAKTTAMPGVQPVTVESRAGIQSRGLGYEPSWSCTLARWMGMG